MMSILVLFIIMTFLLFFSIRNMRQYVLIKQRVERITTLYARIDTKKPITKEDIFKRQYLSYAKNILTKLQLLTSETTKTYTKLLANAGWLSRNALVVYLSIQLIVVFSFLFLALVSILFVPYIAEKPFIVRAILVIFLMWLGYRLPEWYLKRSIKSYKIKLRRSILEFLDLFLICIAAGYGNDKALERISSELRLLHPELSEQVKILTTELRIFPDRREAWDNFAERTGLEEVKVVAQIIKQSEQLGTSIGQALRAQVEMFRSERLSFVEQKAMRLPTLLTLPLVLFIFPALLLVILGPAVLKAMEVLGGRG